jgi:hypothetical protein
MLTETMTAPEGAIYPELNGLAASARCRRRSMAPTEIK